jgi:hypothetical protein
MHTENSGFASPTLGQHISTLRGYRILFSVRNPYINRFTNHFSIHSQCLKWTVAQSPNATNILFGRPKAAPN